MSIAKRAKERLRKMFRGGSTVDEMDKTPVEMPLGYIQPQPLEAMIASMVRQAVENQEAEEFETYEEANDFEPEPEDTLDFSAYNIEPMVSMDLPDAGDPDPTRPPEEGAFTETSPAPNHDPETQQSDGSETGDLPNQNAVEPS